MTEASIAHVQKVVAEKGTDAWWQLPLEDLLPAELRDQAARLKKGEDTMVSINLSFSDQDPHGYWRLLHGYCWRSCGRRSLPDLALWPKGFGWQNRIAAADPCTHRRLHCEKPPLLWLARLVACVWQMQHWAW